MLVRARVLGSIVAASLLTIQTASAVAPRSGRQARPELEATGAGKVALRQHVDVQMAVPPARHRAWDDFTARTGGRWTATWDRATAVPSRLWGGSIHVPGANASPAVAELAARGFLAQHADLLAPGVDVATLELASNHDDGRIRSVGFWQRHEGLRVVGGQISVRFLQDRLYVVSSQIIPLGEVDVRVPRRGDVAEVARAATERDLGLTRARAAAAAVEPVIVPLVAEDRVLGARVAVPVEVDAGTAGRWLVYADPASGDPIVRRNLVRWADGTLVYDVPVRQPQTARQDYGAARTNVTVDGSPTITGAGGEVTWAREASVPLVTTVSGDLVAIRHTGNDEATEATANLTISPAGTTRWSAPGDEQIDAQLTTFVHTQIVKSWARAIVSDPRTLEFIDGAITATVNLDDECNAFYTQGTINFFSSSPTCENTGRLADVIYHEFGHGLHDFSIIDGVGNFDGAMSEGVSDFVAASVTGDPGMGRGFFKNDEPLRHLDPVHDITGIEVEATWPDDVGEIHTTGLIIGGAFWDLRKEAIAALGADAGIALTERLFIAALQRSTDIPSSLIEVLAADDDDGDLSNGTPNECLIREAFGRHGLRTVDAFIDAPGSVPGTAGETTVDVTVAVTGLSVACQGDEIASAELRWRAREGSNTPISDTALLDPQPGDTFTGPLALPEPGDVVEYQVTLTFDDGTSVRFPDNAGDPYYELYRGELVELYCTDFETDPFADGWTHGSDNEAADPWQWGAPLGLGGDPPEAFSGASAVGMTLDGSGLYAPGADTWMRSPVIDVGRYSDVRLQYRRWLGVEDGYYDKATIFANDEIAWQNHDSGQSVSASLHTRDQEWVFRDVPLSTRIYDFTVQLTFDLTADGDPTSADSFLEFGGWTIDDLCVVADPDAICGDGVINGVEQCDQGDGNADEPDACRTNCRVHRCGDGILDSVEECDDGDREAGDDCDADCTFPDGGDGGCCSSNDDPAGALAPIAIVGLGLLVSRRRRRRA